ncbi:acid type B receptor subunit 2 [Seminavis robusta]|uniref:Acid type B receptor subunit 2 n=1 Tax=Seminavis robusta TaxID=568900 RepID=A0A9N8ET01_9STRA|nr:acid type B receptor subunit 2 [Seminavis robusta]|eukprot:Sro1791_g297800.1 acid type B receptor subunit 2 (1065) ;mRNA; r:9310-12861
MVPSVGRLVPSVALLITMMSMSSLSLVTATTSTSIVAFDDDEDVPSRIFLRGGVLHSPPFAFVDKDPETGEASFRGFQLDLLERLKIFAYQDDGIELHVELFEAPDFYTDAFNLIANDCNRTNGRGHCDTFDFMLADFYSNPERFLRADLTHPWLRSTATTIKYLEKKEGSPDYTTLAEAEDAGATVCTPKGTFMEAFAWTKYPRGIYISCEMNKKECIKLLKAGNCSLFVYDELILHYWASQDYTLHVTRESFSTQYVVWPLRQSLPRRTSTLMNKWILTALQNGTLDELYFQYFRNQLCPQGTAGVNCELPCDPDHGEANSRGECICESIKWTGDDCSSEVPEELNLLPKDLIVVTSIMVALSFLVAAGCAAWVVHNRNRATIKVTQPSFLLLVLFGCVVSTSTIIAMAQEDPGDGPVPACMAIPWLYSVGFCITFGSLFARIRRIHAVLQYAAELTTVIVSTKDTVLTIGLVLLVDVVILTTWTIVDPLEWTRVVTSTDVFGNALESEGYCQSEYWVVFAGIIGVVHLLLMGTACYMCYLARSIPNSISNNKFIGIAMFSNLQIFLIVVPVLLIMGSEPQASFFVKSVAIWINDFVVVILIFGNLIFRVYLFDKERKQKSNRNLSIMESKVAIRSNIVAFAERAKSASLYLEEQSESQHSTPSRRRSTVRFSIAGEPDQLTHELSSSHMSVERDALNDEGSQGSCEPREHNSSTNNNDCEEGEVGQSAAAIAVVASRRMSKGSAIKDPENVGLSGAAAVSSRKLLRGCSESNVISIQATYNTPSPGQGTKHARRRDMVTVSEPNLIQDRPQRDVLCHMKQVPPRWRDMIPSQEGLLGDETDDNALRHMKQAPGRQNVVVSDDNVLRHMKQAPGSQNVVVSQGLLGDESDLEALRHMKQAPAILAVVSPRGPRGLFDEESDREALRLMKQDPPMQGTISQPGRGGLLDGEDDEAALRHMKQAPPIRGAVMTHRGPRGLLTDDADYRALLHMKQAPPSQSSGSWKEHALSKQAKETSIQPQAASKEAGESSVERAPSDNDDESQGGGASMEGGRKSSNDFPAS